MCSSTEVILHCTSQCPSWLSAGCYAGCCWSKSSTWRQQEPAGFPACSQQRIPARICCQSRGLRRPQPWNCHFSRSPAMAQTFPFLPALSAANSQTLWGARRCREGTSDCRSAAGAPGRGKWKTCVEPHEFKPTVACSYKKGFLEK